ncbi:hypothetical protein [Photobacterium leiognathi]|uniref:hypothetical protein n=1 Tax=Photobacterium leiognathi TaxID=553611 RepID=UPI000C56C60B|nr:hypothetical protein [Photobacterium leiognathi]PHZ60505.1 hypothetical protein CRG86_005705 [Photobacterium leiognathi]
MTFNYASVFGSGLEDEIENKNNEKYRNLSNEKATFGALLLTVFLSIVYGIYISRTKQHSVELIRGEVVDRVTVLTDVGNKHWLLVSVPLELEAIKVRLPKAHPIKVGSQVMLQKVIYKDSGKQEYSFIRYED